MTRWRRDAAELRVLDQMFAEVQRETARTLAHGYQMISDTETEIDRKEALAKITADLTDEIDRSTRLMTNCFDLRDRLTEAQMEIVLLKKDLALARRGIWP